MQYALIVEDILPTGKWLQNVLEEAFENIQVTHCLSCKQTFDFLPNATLHLALLDISLPDGNGIDLVRTIRQRCPNTYIVITTIFDDEEHILHALQAGANGYLLKDLPDYLFVQKLRGILNGDPPISPSISRRILRYFASMQPTSNPSTQGTSLDIDGFDPRTLSPREQEVLVWVAKGFSRREVANQLDLSTNTVARYIRDIYQKLAISSRAEAAVKACRLGLVEPRN